jgi:hypothetical protein
VCGTDNKNCNLCKVKVIGEVLDIYPEYRPKLGEIYDAEYSPGRWKPYKNYPGKAEFAVVNILDKRIVLRKGEFEIVGGAEDA